MTIDILDPVHNVVQADGTKKRNCLYSLLWITGVDYVEEDKCNTNNENEADQ
jgi:hypothetical protein